MIDPHLLPQIITAVGGLGAAAFGLVDASKAVGGGVNHIGFGSIGTKVKALTPGKMTNGLSQVKILATLKANWFNGTELASQKSIAKSLIKLNLNANNASDLAAATGVDPATLTSVAKSIATGTPLSIEQTDVYARLDFILTAMLDEAYQHSDNVYRNWTRALAAMTAIALALVGRFALDPHPTIAKSLLVGVLATPLAPIAKDLSSALATAVNTLQLVKR